MKILWFTTSPSLAEEKERMFNITGGWIKSEESALKRYHPDIQLGVVFPSRNRSDPYEINGTSYFPVESRQLSKWKKRMLRTNIRKSEYASLKHQYLNIVQKYKPDLVHIHGTENSFGAIIPSVHVPVVVSIQGIVTVCAHKYFSGISALSLLIGSLSPFNKFSIQFNDYRYLRKLEKETLKQVYAVFGRTHFDRRIASVLAPEARYFHIDRVLRNVFYEREWIPRITGNLILVTTLRSSLFKGFEVILETAAILKNMDLDFSWKIIGLSEPDLLVKIERSKFQKVADKVVLLGKLKEHDVVDHLLAADMYVQTSHIENSPNGVAEALALGMPVIASFAGGTSSLIDDGRDGILVQDGDPWILAGAVTELLKNKDQALLMASQARKNAMIRHDPRSVADRIAAAYSVMISKEVKHGA